MPLLCLAALADAREADLDGRLAYRLIYSTDDAGSPDVLFNFLEADAAAVNLTGEGGLRLQLDATFALDSTDDRASVDGAVPAHDRRFGRTESADQVRQLYAKQPRLVGGLDVSVGRKYVESAGNPWVDGVDLELWLDKRRASVGAYGGLRPDPFDHAVSTAQQAMGLYGTLHRDGFDGAAAYNLVLRGSDVDRHFLFNRLHLKAAEGLYLASYVTVDLADEVDTSVLLATVDYTPRPPLNLSLSVSRYSLEAYRDQTIYHDVVEENQAVILGDEVLDLVYHRARFTLSYRFWRHLVHYQWTEYKHRQQDARDAWFYTVGLREESLWGTGLEVDVRASIRNNFKSDSWLVGVDLAKDLPLRLSVETWLTWFSGRSIDHSEDLPARTFDEEQALLWAGAQLSWRPSRSHHFHVFYDAMLETELQDARNDEGVLIHTMMLRYAWVF